WAAPRFEACWSHWTLSVVLMPRPSSSATTSEARMEKSRLPSSMIPLIATRGCRYIRSQSWRLSCSIVIELGGAAPHPPGPLLGPSSYRSPRGASPLADQRGHQARPAGLVGGAQALAGVAVEVFVEQDQVTPVGVLLELAAVAVDRAAALRVAGEDAD